MITRDSVQGFIDGLKASGNDLSNMKTHVEKWLKKHPLYKLDEEMVRKIIEDLESYRK